MTTPWEYRYALRIEGMTSSLIRELLKLEGAESDLLHAILEVTDDAGEIVLEFPFTEAILDVTGEPVTKH